jgi:L-rhamnose mutarotase
MQRIAFTFELKPAADPLEYKRRHAEIWPEMLETLRAAGIRNYDIFLADRRLFATLEVEDISRMAEVLGSSEVNRRWSRTMEPLIDIHPNPAIGFPPLLPLMFHMD